MEDKDDAYVKNNDKLIAEAKRLIVHLIEL
jgi:hypothetical protein